MPETAQETYEVKHTCGYWLRAVVTLVDIKVQQERLSEVEMTYKGSAAYYTRDDKPITHCPKCSKKFPQTAELVTLPPAPMPSHFFDTSQPVDHEKMSALVETMHPRPRLEML